MRTLANNRRLGVGTYQAIKYKMKLTDVKMIVVAYLTFFSRFGCGDC